MHQLDEILAHVRDSIPVADEFQDRARESARRALLAATAAADEPQRRPLSVRRGRRVALAALLAVAIVAAAVLLPTGAGDNRGGAGALPGIGVAPASAQTVLDHAARTVARQSWRPLSRDEWEYYHVELGYPGRNGRASNRPSFTEDTWLAANGAARVVQYTNHAVILIGPARAQLAAERALQQHTHHFQIVTADPPWPPNGFTYQQIVHLPSQPAALRRWIVRQAPRFGGPGNRGTLAFLQGLVLDPRIPPRVSGALYRLIARLPHVRLVGPTRDPLGRAGIAVGFTVTNDTETQVIFDPATGASLAILQVSLSSRDGSPPPGAVESWQAITHKAIVRYDRELPGPASVRLGQVG